MSEGESADRAPAPKPRNSILKNFSTMTGVKVASDVFTFVFFVVLSRIYGQDGIGQYSFGMAVTGFFALFADFGLYNLTIKEASRKTGSLSRDFGASLILRALYTSVGVALLFIAVRFLPLSEQGRTVVLLLGFYQFAYRLTYGMASLFVAREQMGTVAALEFGLRVVTSLAGVAIAVSGGGLVLAVGVMPVVAIAELCVATGLAVRHFGAPTLRIPIAELVDTSKRALPYGLSGVLFQLQSRVDVFFLGILIGEAAVGVYNAAYRIVFLLSFLTYYAGVAIFPAASRLYAESREALAGLYDSSLRAFVLLGVPAATGILLLAPELVPLIFGDAFGETVVILQAMAVLVFLTGLKNLLSFFLMAADGQVERVKSQTTAAFANVALNAALIPVMGVIGAVAAVMLAEMLLVGLLLWRLHTRIGVPRIASCLFAAGVGSACFALPSLVYGAPPMLVLVPAAAGVYTLALFAFRDVRNHEIARARHFIAARKTGGDADPLATRSTAR